MPAPKRKLSRANARRVLWRRGILDWKLRPEQRKLKAELEVPDIQLAVYNICRRFGKTFGLVTYAVEQCIRYKQKIRYGAAFATDLEEFVLPAFEIILSDCPEDLKPKYNRQKMTWRFPNGSEIKLVGLDLKPNGLRGNAIAKIIVDEAGFVTHLERIYKSVIIPATYKQKNIKVIFASTPPPTPDHYFVELINKARTQENGQYVCLTIDDISDLEPLERKRLLDEIGGEDSVEAQREFFCRLIVDASIALCPEFNESVHVKPLVEPDFAKFWLAGDTGGVRDRTVFHLCCLDYLRDVVLFLDEREYPPQTGTGEWLPQVIAMEAGRPLTRHVDAPGQLQIDLMAAGFACSLPRKDELDATVHQVRMALRQRKVEVDPKCRLLIATLAGGTFNNTRSDLARSPTLGHMDAFMSFAYGLRHINRLDPRPAWGGVNPITHHIPHQNGDLSQSAAILKSIFTPR